VQKLRELAARPETGTLYLHILRGLGFAWRERSRIERASDIDIDPRGLYHK